MPEITARPRRLPIQPSVLRWAREWAGQAVEETARRVRVSPARVKEWEDARSSKTPTVRQIRQLADFYNLSFLELIRDNPPEIPEPTLIPDYRLYRGADYPLDTRALRTMQQWAETQRVNALDLFSELNEPVPVFSESLVASTASNIEATAAQARAIMNLTIEDQRSLKSSERIQLPIILRRKFESSGLLTLKQTSLGEHGIRGYCIATFPLPVIVFGKESPSAQAFTLAHELAHIVLRVSAISGPLSRRGGDPQIRRVEEWCNGFAAAFLLPAAEVEKIQPRPGRPAASIPDSDVQRIANYFAVSEHATLIRLVTLGYVRSEYYWDIKKAEFDQQERDYASFGRPKYYGSRYRNALGDLYTSLVIEAWSTGRITNHNAAEFMGIKNLAHLNDIRENFSGGPGD